MTACKHKNWHEGFGTVPGRFCDHCGVLLTRARNTASKAHRRTRRTRRPGEPSRRAPDLIQKRTP